jgi:isopentenyldiphosphate isomerase
VSSAPVDDDVVDVLDDEGRVAGTATRAEVRASNLRHRTVFVAVVNGAGELLVHRRADWKDVWPGAWDIAFGGVVDAGEAWEAAAARELAEEAGLDVELMYLGEGAYEDDQVRERARVYMARHDGPVSFVDGEVVETDWVGLDDVLEWLDERTVCPDSIAIVLPRLDAP